MNKKKQILCFVDFGFSSIRLSLCSVVNYKLNEIIFFEEKKIPLPTYRPQSVVMQESNFDTLLELIDAAEKKAKTNITEIIFLFKDRSIQHVQEKQVICFSHNQKIFYSHLEKLSHKTIESFSYELFDLYKQNINSKHFQIIEDENSYFKLNFSDNEYILSISPITIKGSNYLMIITNKYSVYKLNAKNLDILSYTKIELNYTKKISYNLIPIPLNFFYVLFNKEEKGYFVTKYENSSIIGKCDLFGENETEKIKNYFFEEKSKTIYIISSLNKIYLSIPMLFPSHDSLIKNSCKTVLLSELNKIIENKDNNFDITLLNKKLMITKDGINYEVIDITKIGDVDNNNKLQSKFFELNNYIKTKNNFPPLIMKDNKNYLFVKQINKKDLILYIFYEKNAKIYKTEAPTFNFKVPIILVAFAIILVWNYIKSKNEDTGNDFNKFKNKFD